MLQVARPLRVALLCGLLGTLAACGGGGGGGAATAPAANRSPTAEAGAAQTVTGGDPVTLDGSSSSDPDGRIVDWSWSQTDGPTVDLIDSDQPQARFQAPDFAQTETLSFSVTVTDDDDASSSDAVEITVEARQVLPTVRLAGFLTAPPGQAIDGDTNDPGNPLMENNEPASAQPIGNPATLGGYVNEAGEGAEGRSQVAGDPEDYFAVDLLAGQRINLLVGDFEDADADLYLYDESGELLDFSVETGEVEELTIARSGRYLVNVSIFSGATTYTLAIGTPLGAGSTGNASSKIVPWQLVVDYEDEALNSGEAVELQRRWDARRLSGAGTRGRLLAMQARSATTVQRQRLGRAWAKRQAFASAEQEARWETLMAVKRLRRQPGVRLAEPNYRVVPLASVNDPAYSFQWHYPLINLPGAWDSSTGDPSVIVAVVDTGILSGHPDLTGQRVPGYDFVRNAEEAGDGDGIDPDPEETVGGSDPSAVNFHGSHVAGTVAARGNNGIGVAGVAFDARLMPLRAITASGGTSYDVRQAVRFAAGLENDSGTLPERPADIINLSLGGAGFSGLDQALFDELRDLGIIVVAAAGNEGSSRGSFPAAYANVFSVSAVDSQGEITAYSNRGATIDLAAPGGDGSRDINGDGYPDGVLSTGAADGDFAYTFLSGTSMAAPHVAGVFALMKAVNPALTAADVERLLEAGALTDDLGAAGRDDLYGHGLIDARRAVDAALVEAGGASSLPSRLASSTSALNFGNTRDVLEFTLVNGGSGALTVLEVFADRPWLTVEALDTDGAGLGRYRVLAERTTLDPGLYEATITARSDSNLVTLRVLLTVAEETQAEIGILYLLVYDPTTDQVVAQTAVRNSAAGYRFSLPEVPIGEYLVFAGTDLDNDRLICDPGEACGAFLTIEQPVALEVNADRDDIVFPIEYLIALPGSADTSGRRPAPTLEREEINP